MAKLLVDTQTDEIRGYYKEPLDFSISGRYVIDLPAGLYPETNVVADSITRKLNNYKSFHPTLPNTLNDELLAVPNIDPLISSGFFLGPFKRTEVMPSGYVYTNSMAFTLPAVSALIHLFGFTLYSDPGAVVSHPAPSRLLYNYDPGSSSFFDFVPSVFQVEIVDGAFPYTSRYTFTNADVVESLPGTITSPVRLKFTNIGVIRYHLSDWLLLYG